MKVISDPSQARRPRPRLLRRMRNTGIVVIAASLLFALGYLLREDLFESPLTPREVERALEQSIFLKDFIELTNQESSWQVPSDSRPHYTSQEQVREWFRREKDTLSSYYYREHGNPAIETLITRKGVTFELYEICAVYEVTASTLMAHYFDGYLLPGGHRRKYAIFLDRNERIMGWYTSFPF